MSTFKKFLWNISMVFFKAQSKLYLFESKEFSATRENSNEQRFFCFYFNKAWHALRELTEPLQLPPTSPPPFTLHPVPTLEPGHQLCTCYPTRPQYWEIRYQVTLLTAHHGTWYANILTSGGRWWWVMILLVFDDNGRWCVLYSHSQCLNALDLLQSSLGGKHTSPVSVSELRTRLV